MLKLFEQVEKPLEDQTGGNLSGKDRKRRKQAKDRKEGEAGMKYSKGDVYISVETVDGFGKNPGLYIGTSEPNQAVKVASFGLRDKAVLFCKWLDYLFDLAERKTVNWNGSD